MEQRANMLTVNKDADPLISGFSYKTNYYMYSCHLCPLMELNLGKPTEESADS